MPSDVDTHELRDWWRRRQSRNEYLKSFYRKWRSAWRRYESASAVLHDLDPQFRHGAGRAQSLAVRLPVSTESGLLLPAWMCQRPSDLDYLELYRRIELAGAGAEERHDIAANVLQRDVADVRRSYYSALRAVKSSLKEQERAVVERSLRPSRPR